MFADAELRQKYLLALLTRDARVWHRRTEARATWSGPDDKIERNRKTAQRRKLIRLRDERIRAGLKIKRYALPTGAMACGERPDNFTAADAVCIACGKALEWPVKPSRTCSAKCYRAVQWVKRKAARAAQAPKHRMVNDSKSHRAPRLCLSPDLPATRVPRRETLTSGL